MERLDRSLRKHLLRLRKNESSERRVPLAGQALRWSVHAAEAIAYIDANGVVQGDIGCYNLLLDRDGNIKLCDFGGSSIDGCDLRVGYGIRSQLWKEDDSPSVACELFALGSMIFEIWTTQQPYEDLADEEAEKRYGRCEFPTLKDPIPSEIAQVIRKCWLGEYTSAGEVLKDLGNLDLVTDCA